MAYSHVHYESCVQDRYKSSATLTSRIREGVYQCVAVNGFGLVMSNPANLHVDGIHTFYRAMHMHKRGLCCHPVSVCLSVTFRSSAKTNKDILEIFSPSGSDTILVFPYRRGCRYSDGNPLTGASNTRGYEKFPIFFTNISLYPRNGYT